MRNLTVGELESLEGIVNRYAKTLERVCGKPISLDENGIRQLDRVIDRLLQAGFTATDMDFIQAIATIWA